MKTPAGYLATAPPGRREILEILHNEILKAVPAFVPGICHGIIGYGIGPRPAERSCDDDWFKVGPVNQKHHIGLYLRGCGDITPHVSARSPLPRAASVSRDSKTRTSNRRWNW